MLAAGLALVGTQTASGQAMQTCPGSMVSMHLTHIGDDSVTSTDPRPVSAADCANMAALKFDVRGLPTTNTNLTYYASKGGTADCTMMAVRNPTNVSDDENPCIQLGATVSYDPNANPLKVEVPITADLCSEGLETDATIYLLPSNSDTISGDVTGYGCFSYKFDAKPPAAPTNLNRPQGERTLTLTWTASSDQSVQQYVAFYDNNVPTGDGPTTPTDDDAGTVLPSSDGGITGTTNVDCPSDFLIPGEFLDPDNLPDGVGAESETGQFIEKINISGAALDREVTPVAVAAIDRAGNIGPLSEVTCLEKVDTVGLWELYKDNGGQAEGGCACTTLTRHSAAGALPIGVALMGLWWAGRRRRM